MIGRCRLEHATSVADRKRPMRAARRDQDLERSRRARARAKLADTGMTVAREDLALEAAFWAQLPGNFPMRPRKAPITSRNFAAMVPFHNYPAGRATGNHWGDALTLLMTSARSPFHFSLHATDPTDPDGGSRKDTGHTLDLWTDGLGQDRLHRVSGRDALRARARPRSSSTRTGGLRSWCAPWAASTARSRTASRRALIR